MARPRKGAMSKARLIRAGLAEHPDLGRTELAALLNEQVKAQGLELGEITPADISVYRSQQHKAGADGSASSAQLPNQSGAAVPVAGIAELVRAARLLLDRLGREEAIGLLDALAAPPGPPV